MDKITHISLTSLKYRADRINQGDINVLAENIKTYGLRQPLLVTSDNGKFMVVDGRRRLEACKKIGMANIPCIILTKDEINEDLSLILNTHRLNLNVVELYQMAARYVKDELKGDPMALPPEKIKMVAAKLNLDIYATCRVLNVGRLNIAVCALITKEQLPLRLALLTIHIKQENLRVRFCKMCEREHPSTSEAVAWIQRETRDKNRPYRNLYDVVFDMEDCNKCRYRGRRDKSLFEDSFIDKDDNENKYCWNIDCFNKKTDEAWKSGLNEAREKQNLAGIKRGTEEYVYDLRLYNKVNKKDTEKCKTCKQVKLIHDNTLGIYCPPTCSNIKALDTTRDGKKKLPSMKDVSKLTPKDKKVILENRFCLAARKVMIEDFLENKKFKTGRRPTDYRRILFFVGYDAHENPFAMMDLWENNFPHTNKTEKEKEKVVAALDLKKVAKYNLEKAAHHLLYYDQAGITPEDINKAIELLYGEKKWCATHYNEIVEKLSKKSKIFLKDIKPWRPSWSRRK